jgi:hypothetical protein
VPAALIEKICARIRELFMAYEPAAAQGRLRQQVNRENPCRDEWQMLECGERMSDWLEQKLGFRDHGAEKKRLIIGKKFCYLKRIEEPFSGDV